MHIGVCGEANSKGSGYEGHEFLEASSLRKFDGRYYFIYSSLQSHELCYAVSNEPTKGFVYGGTLISNGDIGFLAYNGKTKGGERTISTASNDTGNTHGSLIEINGQHYVFYHRQSNRKQSSRQACAEKIRFENGKFYQAEMTSCGLNEGPLKGKGRYPSHICCNLYGKKKTKFLSMIKRPFFGVPYLTQDEPDYKEEEGKNPPKQYVKNVCDKSVIGYKFFDLSNTKKIKLLISGNAKGRVEVWGKDRCLGSKRIELLKDVASVTVPLEGGSENEPIFIHFEGKGHFSFYEFTLE